MGGVQETNLSYIKGIQQKLVSGDNVNLIGDDIKAIERNWDVLLNAYNTIGFALYQVKN